MSSIDFLKHLNRKLKTGNLRSIHLNALPGRYATRLDLSKLSIIKDSLGEEFLETLLSKTDFKFTVSYDQINLNNLDEEEQGELSFVTKKLNGTSIQNNDNFLEHGIKTFGFGYPILIKRDKKDANKIIKAPLLIWHLDIEKSSRKKNEWRIIKEEDYAITLNEVLISHIEQDEDITIRKLASEFLEDNLIDKGELVQISKEVLDQLNALDGVEDFNTDTVACPSRERTENITGNIAWISWSGVFGLFRAQKESIITDIDKLIENFDSFEFDKLKIETYQTSTVSGVETDPSQEEILNKLTRKPARIIQGPPGTGKSQSLTAIITNALESGAKCLVVCEKKTALNVLYENLGELGLSRLCAVVDDVSTDRKKIIENVRATVDDVKNSVGYFRDQEYKSTLKSYKKLRQEINTKHQAVMSKVFGDDQWKDVIGKHIAQDKIESKNVLGEYLNQGDYKHDFDEFQALTKIVEDGHYLYDSVNTLEHPFEVLNKDIFDGPYLNTTRTDIEESMKTTVAFCSEKLVVIKNGIEDYGKRFQVNSRFNTNLVGFLSIFSTRFKEIKKRRKDAKEGYLEFVKWHEKTSYFDFPFIEIEELSDYKELDNNLSKYSDQITKLLEVFNSFQEFFEYKSFLLSLSNNQYKLVIGLIKSGVQNWDSAFQSWYYDGVLRKHEAELGPFHQNSRKITQLAKLTTTLREMQRDKISDYWASKQNAAVIRFKSQKGKINILYNLAKNNQYKRKNSLRKLLHTDFAFFTDFFPVVMMNPVVASSVLPLKEGLFDIVIFDEASQLRLEDTYTSFIRGKYKIVSGDVHQMPPSNYFGKEIILDFEDTDEDLDEDNDEPLDDSLEMADKESLLQFGVDSGFDKSYLDFHYRSRHPYLIDFSNAAFYGSRLTPMPEKYSYKPIRFHQVNGLYEKNRTNPAEAAAVVDILFNHIHPKENGDYPSVGVATFNMDQRNLILELIQDECYLNKERNIVYEQLREDGLFIKNLENIQGDERDIIIISTTFGLNAEGKFRQNFGPINRVKGYKLLNVIVTRAKHRLFVCTSIPSEYFMNYREEIDSRGNMGKGIFYAYLAYAKSIEDGDLKTRDGILNQLKEHCAESEPAGVSSFVESPFEQEVYDYLTDSVDKDRIAMQYEFGGFRIDFVIKSKVDDKPIIALECDGATYHSSEEAYAHDMYRQKQIERGMGLKFYRIWSTNWWIDPQKEVQKLVEFINSVDLKDEKRAEGEQQLTLGQGLRFSDDPLSELQDESSMRIDKPVIEMDEQPLEIVEKSVEDSGLKVVTVKSSVKIRNIHDETSMVVSFTENKGAVDLKSKDNKVLYYQSPMAVSLIDKREGENFKIDGIEVYYQIIKITS